jgi:hypothetical protein
MKVRTHQKRQRKNYCCRPRQAAIGMAVGNPLQIFGGIYAQYWTQSPFSSQYKTIDQYQSNPSDFNRVWGILYNDALRDITVLEQSKKITMLPLR